MKTATKQAMKGFLIFAVLISLAVILLWRFLSIFVTIDKSVQASIIAGAVALISVILTFLKERNRSIREAHREKKVEIYSIFSDMIINVIIMSRKKGNVSDTFYSSQEFLDRMFEMKKGLMFYGSPKVLNNFCAWQLYSEADHKIDSPTRMIELVGDVILAMRSDIGLSNRGLNSLSIQQLIITEDVKRAV